MRATPWHFHAFVHDFIAGNLFAKLKVRATSIGYKSSKDTPKLFIVLIGFCVYKLQKFSVVLIVWVFHLLTSLIINNFYYINNKFK